MTFVLNHAELQPMNGEVFTGSSSYIQDGARLDIVANGFWGGRFECTFFGVQIFNPHAPSNRNSHCYRKHKRQYKQQVREVEHASFTPLVCQLQVVWPTKILCSTRSSPPAWQQNGINLIAQLCSGCSADLLSPFSIQQFNVSGVPFQLWIWLSLN